MAPITAPPSGLDAYFLDDHGREVVPASGDDWRTWVAASSTRNWCLGNGLVDWLELYGAENGFERDPEPDPRTDWLRFIFGKGQEFERAILGELEARVGVFAVPAEAGWRRTIEAAELTFEAMSRGEPIIAQGVLRNPHDRTFGAADLLIRSDALRSLFPDAIGEEAAAMGAPGLGATAWHYRVVDIKYSTLKLGRAGGASATDHLPYMVQVWLYNRALGRIQGFLPEESYLLGRGWRQGSARGKNAFERLGAVPDSAMARDVPLATRARSAVEWMRSVRSEGEGWDPLADGCQPELLPPTDAGYPWAGAIARIAAAREDVTLAWQVGRKGRAMAMLQGVAKWTDPRFCAAVGGVTGVKAGTLDQMLTVNRDPDSPAVTPARIRTEVESWGSPAGVEFFVDFETVSSVNDSFESVPDQGGQPLIFMIGCGHLEDGKWQFRAFTATALDGASEAAIVEEWLGHMEEVRRRLAPEVAHPLVFHWSPAETASFSGLESARTRNPERARHWKEPHWFDFLNTVMRREPIIVRGPMGFGLKTIARSLRRHGLIETEWGDGITDGLGAMVGAWWCAGEAKARGCRLDEIDLVEEIRAYNEVDCRVMMEAITLFRGRAAG